MPGHSLKSYSKLDPSFPYFTHILYTQTTGQKKTVNLTYDGEKYSPVVYIKTDGKVGIVSLQQPTTSTPSNSQVVEIAGYTPGDVILISDIEEEQLMEENSPQQESTQVVPSSNPAADGITQDETPAQQSSEPTPIEIICSKVSRFYCERAIKLLKGIIC